MLDTTKTAAILTAAAAVTTLALGAAAPNRAAACGGCFAAPTATQVVTAHRMAVAISATETTLWDQIQYAGAPEDFVWVLPTAGTDGIELGDEGFFAALEQTTAPVLTGRFPPRNCPSASCGGSYASARHGGDFGPMADAGVTVFSEEVVGPYETATIGSDDAMALVDWLQAHGYAVPDAILPTIAYYVGAHMNFVALRLSPNAGVDRMQPVRITTPGLNPIFPLRMVAAGVTDSVELELFIFGEGRYELANFPTRTIDPAALHFDWRSNTFNYDDIFSRTVAQDGGRGWIVEFSGLSPIEERGLVPTADVAGDYAIIQRSLPSPTLTRLRTSLTAAQLDEDLVLQAALGEGGDSRVSNLIDVTHQVHIPPCPDVPFCPFGGACGSCAIGAAPAHPLTSALTAATLTTALALLLTRRGRGRGRGRGRRRT